MGRAGIAVSAMLCAAAYGQTILDSSKIPEAFKRFAQPAEGRVLRCDPSPVRPVLNFGFRFQAGYLVRVPMDQYQGKGHTWVILQRVTPEGDPSHPVYLGDKFVLPEVPKTTMSLPVVGGFLLGEGRYHVDWLMADETGRSAVRQWTLEAQRSHADRNVQLAQPPGAVAEFSLRGSPKSRSADDAAPLRLTVLLDAAPMSPRRFHARLRPSDQIMLLGGLSSLLERVPTRSVRLVVFNLDQQRELYRKDAFRPEDLDSVGQVLNQTELGLVDYHVLQRPLGHLDFLAGVVNREVHEAETADVVLVMGPRPHFTDRIPPADLESSGAPRFLYLQYQPFLHATSQLPDTIRLAVKTMHGKTLVIRTPADFAKALAALEHK